MNLTCLKRPVRSYEERENIVTSTPLGMRQTSVEPLLANATAAVEDKENTASAMENINVGRRKRLDAMQKRLTYSQVGSASTDAATESPAIAGQSHENVDRSTLAAAPEPDNGPIEPSARPASSHPAPRRTAEFRETRSTRSKRSADNCQSPIDTSTKTRKMSSRRKSRLSDETIEAYVQQVTDFACTPVSADSEQSTDKNMPNETDSFGLAAVAPKSDRSAKVEVVSLAQEAPPRRTVHFRETRSTRSKRSTGAARRSSRRKTRLSDETVADFVQQFANFDNREVSTTSYTTTEPSTSPAAAVAGVGPKRSTRGRVAFEPNAPAVDAGGAMLRQSDPFHLKGGKWRRTIFDLRKTRATTCKR